MKVNLMLLKPLCGLLLILANFVNCADEVPIFEWVKYDHINAELKITFPDNQDTDFALLTKTKNFINTVDNNDCIFSGNLVEEPDIPVSLTHICDDKDNFEISVNSRKLSHYMFKVTNGKVEALTSTLLETDTSTFVSKEAQQLGDGISLKQLPPQGFVLQLKLFYDQSFREAFGSRVESVLNRVVSHAQTIYYWPSLMTKVKLEVVEVEGIDTRYSSSGDNLDFLGSTYSTRSSSSINANVYFCVESGGGQVGIANVGAVCLQKLQYRSAIVEHDGYSDASSAETLAHELGHLLGMDHDFIQRNNKHYQRYDSLRRKCKDIESIMDYVDNSKQWSTCSVEDFAKYYSNHKSFCLPLITETPDVFVKNDQLIILNLKGDHKRWLSCFHDNCDLMPCPGYFKDPFRRGTKNFYCGGEIFHIGKQDVGDGVVRSCDIIGLKHWYGSWFSCNYNNGESCTKRPCPGKGWNEATKAGCSWEAFHINAVGKMCGDAIEDGDTVNLKTKGNSFVTGDGDSVVTSPAPSEFVIRTRNNTS